VKQFASSKGARFPILAKGDVNGANATPLYKYLKSQAKSLLGENIEWNFGKFLVGKDGKVIKRYPPTTNPRDLESDIEKALKA
jgi:glutathione peroxidase